MVKHVRKSFLNFQFMVYYTRIAAGEERRRTVGQESSLKQQVKEVDGVSSLWTWKRETGLPSEEKLSTMFGVSRVTIRSALKELEMERAYIFQAWGGDVCKSHGKEGSPFNPGRSRAVWGTSYAKGRKDARCAGGRRHHGGGRGKKPSHHLACHWGETMVAVKKAFLRGQVFPCTVSIISRLPSRCRASLTQLDYLYRYKGRGKAMWDTMRIRR